MLKLLISFNTQHENKRLIGSRDPASGDFFSLSMNGAVSFSQGGMGRPLKQAWKTYMKHLDSSPVRTKAFTSVVAAVLGDLIAQRASKPANSPDWRNDWARTARFAVFAGAFGGPVGHYWYRFLDGRIMPHNPKSAQAVFSKVALDQLLFAPACTPVFYGYKVTAEGRPGEFVEEVKDKFAPTLIAGYKLWPAAHLINFALVPPNQRILYANVVSIAGTYLLSRAAAGDFSKKTEVIDDLVVRGDDLHSHHGQLAHAKAH